MISAGSRRPSVHQANTHSCDRQVSERITTLERHGHWLQARIALQEALVAGLLPADGDHLHWFGRLHQRLGAGALARRAYQAALWLDSHRPATFNNLALLELAELDAQQSEAWLRQGLQCPDLDDEQADLLHATACELYLYKLRPDLALHYVQRQLRRRASVMALANQAICYHKLGAFQKAVAAQLQAITLQLQQHAPALAEQSLAAWVGKPLPDLAQSAQLQLQLMNLGIYRLLCQPDDAEGLQLLLAGTSNDPSYWVDPRCSATRWQGQAVEQLILWDDQGFGDSIQNLFWIDEAAVRAQRLRLWLRPALLRLVQNRCRLPANVTLEPMASDAEPWAQTTPQLGLFFLPMVLGTWPRQSDPPRTPWLRRPMVLPASGPRRVGLVWSAGRHRAPQPERSARVRDVPFDQLWVHALRWQQQHQLQFVSLQLEGHDQPSVAAQLESGRLQRGLQSADWMATAECLEQLDLLVSVDTSVAHLAGALGVPCVLLLSAPADWRWGQEGTSTSLYSSFSLARCQVRDAWHTALQQADLQVTARLSAEQP